jgi:DNA (cytosine-5)-methyltransferase 1
LASPDAVDLFAGPGGWDVAATRLGLSVVGIELDAAACKTREAAGHPTVQADVAALDPRDHPAPGLIASAPCPTFSAAGNGNGHRLTAVIVECAEAIMRGEDTRATATLEAERILAENEKAERAKRDAAMSVLVVEPLRWAVANRPQWIALEQVPPVLPLWKAFAAMLQRIGYACWTGILEAERYGVPQTRERAFLLARLDGVPCPPAPTHQRYVPGEPQRHDVTLEGEILPWVSMAEALGWGMTERPGMTFAPGTAQGGPDVAGGSGARRQMANARDSGAWLVNRFPSRTNQAVRHGGEPAPTVTGGNETQDRQWVANRPATNVNGDPRISAPGHHDANESGSQQKDAIRVTVEEAAILQGFAPDYPWQGSRTAQFQQVGNAVPPPLALAVLAALLGIERPPLESDAIPAKQRATHWDRRAAPSAGVEPRAVTEPAPTVLAQGLAKGRDVWRDERPDGRDGVTHARFGNQDHSAVRAVTEPAATLRYSARMNANDWIKGDSDGQLPRL